METGSRRTRGLIGTTASIVAAVLIIAVLALVYERGTEAAFHGTGRILLAALIATGLAAYYGYIGYARVALWRMKHLSPIALLLGALAVVAGARDPELGGGLVFAAYLVESQVALKLYRDYHEESPVGAKLFLLGVTVFVAGLPLILLLGSRLAIVPLAATIVKTVGLLLVLWGLLRGPGPGG